MGSGHGVVGKPWPAASPLPGRGCREEGAVWVWVEASKGALGQFVTLAGTKDKSGFWVRARDCPRSDLNPKRQSEETENQTFPHQENRPLSRGPNLFGFGEGCCVGVYTFPKRSWLLAQSAHLHGLVDLIT